MLLKTARMHRIRLPLLTGFLCLGMAGHAFAEGNDDPDRVVMPSEWVGRRFDAPTGEPHCIDEASVSLSGAALKRLCEAARNGNAQSPHNLGQLFYLTKGAQEQDHDDACKRYHLAAEQGLPDAQHGLSLRHGKGLGIAGRIDEVIKWLTRAANGGHANAQFGLGIYCASAMRASDSNTEKAYVWLRQSAKNGHPLAAEVLTNTSKRMAQGSGSATDTGNKYDFSNSLAACTEGYNINHPKPATQEEFGALCLFHEGRPASKHSNQP
jgi:TPR repeat protein